MRTDKPIPDNVDPETGEILENLKPYETPKHLSIKTEITNQQEYINDTLRDEHGKITRLNGDTMSLILIELSAYYEWLSAWLSNEKLHLDDLKTAYDLKFAYEYMRLKKEGETNGTATQLSKIYCHDDQVAINTFKHGYKVVEAWKKSIARYNDSIRSVLSYEKQIGFMSKEP